MEHATRVAEVTVRQDRDEIERPKPMQHLALDDDRPAMLEHAHLAAILVLRRRRRLLEGVRLGLVDGAVASLNHQVREGQIVAEAGIDLDVLRAAHSVDRSVAAGDRVEARLVCAQRELVTPVDALLVRAVAVRDVQSAADVRDVGIGEVADEHAQRRGLPGAVRVGECDDLGVSLAARHCSARQPCRRARCGSPSPPLRQQVLPSGRLRRRSSRRAGAASPDSRAQQRFASRCSMTGSSL